MKKLYLILFCTVMASPLKAQLFSLAKVEKPFFVKQVYFNAGFSQPGSEDMILNFNSVFNYLGDQFTNTYYIETIDLLQNPVSWESAATAGLGFNFTEYRWKHIGAGLELRLDYFSFQARQARANHELVFSGNEMRASLRSFMVISLKPFKLYFKGGLSSALGKNYRALLSFNGKDEFVLNDDFFRNTDFCLTTGLSLSYAVQEHWTLMLSYDRFESIIFKRVTAATWFPILYTAQIYNFSLGLGYTW